MPFGRAAAEGDIEPRSTALVQPCARPFRERVKIAKAQMSSSELLPAVTCRPYYLPYANEPPPAPGDDVHVSIPPISPSLAMHSDV